MILNILKEGLAEKKAMKLREVDEFQRFLLNLFFMPSTDDHYCLIKFACLTDMLKKAETIGFLRSDEKEIEIIIITEHFKEVREKHSNMNIAGLDGKTKKIISWSHNKKEIEEGLERKEEYFVNLIKNSKEIFDRKDNLKELKKKVI